MQRNDFARYLLAAASIVFALLTFYFLYSDNADAAFVSAIFAISVLFLSLRFQIAERIRQRSIDNTDPDS